MINKAGGLFRQNIRIGGRQIRGFASLLFFLVGFALTGSHGVMSVLLFASATFLLFEALRGWCALRAWGFRTKF